MALAKTARRKPDVARTEVDDDGLLRVDLFCRERRESATSSSPSVSELTGWVGKQDAGGGPAEES